MLWAQVEQALTWGEDPVNLCDLDEDRKLQVLLGARVGCKIREDRIDMFMKRFLRKAWRIRRRVTHAVNTVFDRSDEDFGFPGPDGVVVHLSDAPPKGSAPASVAGPGGARAREGGDTDTVKFKSRRRLFEC